MAGSFAGCSEMKHKPFLCEVDKICHMSSLKVSIVMENVHLCFNMQPVWLQAWQLRRFVMSCVRVVSVSCSSLLMSCRYSP